MTVCYKRQERRARWSKGTVQCNVYCPKRRRSAESNWPTKRSAPACLSGWVGAPAGGRLPTACPLLLLLLLLQHLLLLLLLLLLNVPQGAQCGSQGRVHGSERTATQRLLRLRLGILVLRPRRHVCLCRQRRRCRRLHGWQWARCGA